MMKLRPYYRIEDEGLRARPVGLSLNDRILAQVDARALALQTSRSDVIRRAIERELAIQRPAAAQVAA